VGKGPPAFHILFWNAHTPCLPARLHSDYIDLYFTNPFVNSKKLSLNGTAIDMERVNVDSYVIAGDTDTIRRGRRVIRRRRTWASIRHSSYRTAVICRACSTRPATRKPPSLPDRSNRPAR